MKLNEESKRTMTGLLERYRGRFTLERLKVLYSELLACIDVSGNDLGQRRGIEGEQDTDKKHFLSLNILTHSLAKVSPTIERKIRRSSHGKRISDKGGLEIAAALRFMAATKSPDKEGENGGAAAWRDDECVSALATAKKMESRVVNLIRKIGDVVVNGEKLSGEKMSKPCNTDDTIACDPCFEYFCEKNMLSLLVDIAKENPVDQSNVESAQHGVVWSPLVKAQVLQTVALLVSAGFRNTYSLYYILSQNSINELISCMLPLSQWTDPALEKIVPAFVDLLKNLGLLLAGNVDKDLFPFFTVKEAFPLLHAALEIGTSSYAQMDSFVHITCLSLIVNIMKIDNPAIHTALPEMRKLSNHLCQLLLNRFHRVTEQTTGPVVDGLRCNALGGHLKALQDQIQLLNDVFSCGIPSLNVRLCEYLMSRVVSVLLKSIDSPKERAFIDVGVPDLDMIPLRESQAQVALFFLAQLFYHVSYPPFVRMLAVSLFHPKSTSHLIAGEKAKVSPSKDREEEYLIVPALDAIAQGKAIKDEVIDNPYRRAFLKTLKGDFGAWRFPIAASVVETAVWSEAVDAETLQILEIIPRGCRKTEKEDDNLEHKEEKSEEEKCAGPSFSYIPTALEESLVEFLTNGPLSLSAVSTQCLECAGSLSLSLFYKSTMSATQNGLDCHNFKVVVTPIHKALVRVKAAFCRRALDSQKCLGVADMALELAETAIRNRYKKVEISCGSGTRVPPSQPATYACHLAHVGCNAMVSAPENLVRKYRCPKFTEVEEARFNIEMAIHFRTLCKIIQNFLDNLGPQAPQDEANSTTHRGGIQGRGLDLIDFADDFALTFGGLRDKPDVGMDLDLRGRMTFPCFLQATQLSPAKKTKEDTLLQEAATLILVVDPTDIYIAQIMSGTKGTRGTIVCRIGIPGVIAAASDSEWLHIAVRHPDVGLLIKNGNMVLQFDKPGTSLIVREYLDRCRNTVRRELMDKFHASFEMDCPEVVH